MVQEPTRSPPFSWQKSCTTAPIEALQIIAFGTVVYFMTGYQAHAGKFIIYLVVLVLFALMSETVGHLCAITTKSSHNGLLSSNVVPSGFC